MKRTVFLLGLILSQLTFAQLKVANSGNVGIQLGTTTPLSPLSIGGIGAANTAVDVTGNTNGVNVHRIGTANYNWTYGVLGTSDITASNNVGVRGQSYSATPIGANRAWGLFGLAGNATSGYNYGVFGTTIGYENGAGIVGTIENNQSVEVPGILAGYFVGDVEVTGTINGVTLDNSDIRYKKNIIQLHGSKTLNKILLMNPIEYNLKQLYNESKGDTTSVTKGIYKEESQQFQKKHYGLVAQDLQKLYPDLVYENTKGYLRVNYSGIIPLLIQSIKELNTEIETLKKNNNSSSPAKIGANPTPDASETDPLTYPILDQNIPNPFNTATTIGFYLPSTIANASIYVYDMNGVQLKSYSVAQRGKDNLTIQGSEFNAGMYLYALIADGKVIDTKRMILTK